MRLKAVIPALAVCLVISGCAQNGSRYVTSAGGGCTAVGGSTIGGAAVGGIAGGLIGNAVGGSRGAGVRTALGAVAGAVGGGMLGSSLEQPCPPGAGQAPYPQQMPYQPAYQQQGYPQPMQPQYQQSYPPGTGGGAMYAPQQTQPYYRPPASYPAY